LGLRGNCQVADADECRSAAQGEPVDSGDKALQQVLKDAGIDVSRIGVVYFANALTTHSSGRQCAVDFPDNIW
jgi:hypothetical protein